MKCNQASSRIWTRVAVSISYNDNHNTTDTSTNNNINKTKISRTTITRKQKWEEKQLYGHFKRQTREISYEKRETESLLIAAQNNSLRTNDVKVKVDKKQQNSRCMFCGDGNGMINHRISECSKLAPRGYETRHDWMGKVINWGWLVGLVYWVLWHINLYVNNLFYLKQFSLA